MPALKYAETRVQFPAPPLKGHLRFVASGLFILTLRINTTVTFCSWSEHGCFLLGFLGVFIPCRGWYEGLEIGFSTKTSISSSDPTMPRKNVEEWQPDERGRY